MTARRDQTIWVLLLMAVPFAAAFQVMLAYRASPLVAVVAPAAIAASGVIVWRPMLGVYVALLVVPLDLFQAEFGGRLKFSATEVAILLTAVATLAHLLLGRERPRLHQAHKAFAGVVAVCATGMFFAIDAGVVARITAFWLAVLIVCVLVASATPREAEWALVCLVVAGGIVGLIAVIGAGPQEVKSGGEVVVGRATGTFTHANVLTFFLMLGLAPAFALAGSGPLWRRVLMLVCAGLIAPGIMLAIARGGIAGTIVSLLVLMVWGPFRRPALLTVGALVLAVAFNVQGFRDTSQVTLVTERFAGFTSGRITDVNTRFDIWATTPEIIADHPLLGVGAGNYRNVSGAYGLLDYSAFAYDHAHNLLLTIGAELGLIGLGLFLAFLWGVARAAAAAMRDRRSEHFPLALACTAAMIGLFVTGVGEYPPRTSTILVALMIEIGVLIALARAAGRDRQPGPQPQPGGSELARRPRAGLPAS